MKVVIVGAGGMGNAWAKNIRECRATNLVGWADVNGIRLEASAANLGGAKPTLGTDFAELVRDLKPDFVVDVTPPEVHRDVVVRSLELGVPVLGEKPMADSLEAARDMVRASERAGLLYMVSQSRRYNPYLWTFQRQAAKLGELGILNADFYLGPHFGGFRDEMDSPLVLDMAIHTFDAARCLTGLDAESVYCEEYNPPWSWYKGNASANALFSMAGGVRFTYRGSWCAIGRPTSWESEWRAVGRRGTALWDGHETVAVETSKGEGGFFNRTLCRTVSTKKEGFAEGIRGSLREFLSALRNGKTPMGECHDNFKSLAMVFSAVESARTGVRVALPSV